MSLIVAVFALSGRAEAGEVLCGRAGQDNWRSNSEIATGTWTLKHLAGWARAGAMVIPFPASNGADEVTILMIGDDLVMDHPEAQQPVVFEPADHERRWTVSDDAPPGLVTPDQAAVTAGCDQKDLPRLIGHSSAVVDGHPMKFTFRLMLVSTDKLYGSFGVDTVANGMPVMSRRVVYLRRVGS